MIRSAAYAIVLAGLILGVLMGAVVFAQPMSRPEPRRCADRALVVQRLAERYGETLRSMGLHENEGLVEIYSSEATGTWTILMTRPDGTSCMLAAGVLWEQDAAPLGDPA